MTDTVIDFLRRELARSDRPANRINYQQFFKETLAEPTGLRSAVLKDIAKRGYAQVRSLPPKEMLALCDRLLDTRERYMRFFAFDWALKFKKHFTPSQFARFEKWLKQYVDNWGASDSLCCGPLGELIAMFPQLARKTKPWIKSKDRWHRRAAAVTLIVPVRNGLLLDEVLDTADRLLLDDDDMVQKGYGWMLKEATRHFPKEVFAYVMKHKEVMPRTALRYAIEKLPPAMKKQAMART
jgi:3-methyladenine DNA glycosylase AlkD